MSGFAEDGQRTLKENAERILADNPGYAEENNPHGAAQAYATLALVEATERLAVAQETANLIARQVWASNTAIALGVISPEVLEQGTAVSEEIARRLEKYTS